MGGGFSILTDVTARQDGPQSTAPPSRFIAPTTPFAPLRFHQDGMSWSFAIGRRRCGMDFCSRWLALLVLGWLVVLITTAFRLR